MKKILSLLTVMTILLTSVVAEAAFSVENYWETDYVMISPVETKSDVAARTPNISVVETKKIDQAAAKAAGVNVGSGRTEKKDTNADFYKVTYKVDNIGDLYIAFSDETDAVHSVKILNVQITVPELTASTAYTESTFGGVAWSVSGAQMQWTCGSNSSYAYPTTLDVNTGEYVSGTEIEIVVYYIVAKDYTYTGAPTMTFTYAQCDGVYDEGLEGYAWGDTEGVDVVRAAAANLVLPPVEEEEEEEEPGIEADNDGKVETLVTETKKYGIAKFSQAINPAKDYYVYAKDTDNNTNITITDGTIAEKDKAAASKFKIDFGDIKFDTEGNVSFYALIHSTTHTIATMRLIAVDK